MPTSSSAVHVRADDLGKRFVLLRDQKRLLGLSRHAFRAKEHLWALRHVSFEIAQGGALGVIGPNGSGKSTLLRVMAGVTAPTEGVAEVRGRVASLITIGAGFQGELTGRENMYVGGAVLGMTRKEVDAAASSILEFSGLGDAIERPVKHYSSGMFMRLAFAVGIYAQPEVLLIDEVIAVGDAAFRARCNERVTEMLGQGVTLLFVSHNMEMVSRLCPRSIVLAQGRAVFQGDTKSAVARYFALIDTEVRSSETDTEFEVDADVQAVAGGAVVEACDFLDERGAPETTFGVGAKATLVATVRLDRPVRNPGVRFAVGSGVTMLSHMRCGTIQGEAMPGDRIEVRIPLRFHMGPGEYSFVLSVRGSDENQLMLRHRFRARITEGGGSITAWGVTDLEADPQVTLSSRAGEGVA